MMIKNEEIETRQLHESGSLDAVSVVIDAIARQPEEVKQQLRNFKQI